MKPNPTEFSHSEQKEARSLRKFGSNPKVKNTKNLNNLLFSISTPVLTDNRSKQTRKSSKGSMFFILHMCRKESISY